MAVGLAAGTAVDSGLRLATWPIREGVFLGAYKYDNDPDRPWQTLEDPHGRDYGDELVGVAVSGGGSRAAYFLACVLDEMRHVPASKPGDAAASNAPGSKRTLLDEVDFLSAVSGGSLASAYYVMKRPGTSDPAALDAFFAQYKEDMRKDFETRSLARALFMFRWFPLMMMYYNRGHLLCSTWDANFFEDATFADLRPPGGGVPSLLINAASYSTANKFVFSRIPTQWLNESQVFRALNENTLLNGSHSPEFTPFLASGFDRLGCDVGPYKISHAVAASASVPGLIGPMVLRDEAGGYETLADGGLYDNYGLETMLQALTRVLDDQPGRRARLIVVDGTGTFFARMGFGAVGPVELLERTTAVTMLRSAVFAEIIYKIVPLFEPTARSRGAPDPFDRARSPYRNLTIEVVSMYAGGTHLADATARQPGTYAPLDLVTGRAIVNTIQDVNAQVRGIGTRFSLDDEDALVLERRARQAVKNALGPAPAASPSPGEPVTGEKK